MIDFFNFQINLLGLALAIIFLIFIILKKGDLISILFLTSSFFNLVIFNVKSLTFGFQLFFLFSIILIFKNLKQEIKTRKYIYSILLFLLVVLLSEIFAYLSNDLNILSKLSPMNITQYLYLLFFFFLFISLFFEKINIKKAFYFYLYGLNINFFIQILEIIFFILYQKIPQIFINLSFLPEIVQKVYFKNFILHRISGLFPTPPLVGIYLSLGLFILFFFPEFFSKKFLTIQYSLLIFSGLLSFSSTFFLGLLILFIAHIFKSKNYYFIVPTLIIFLILLLTLSRETVTIRLRAAFSHWQIFLKYPLLGIGWGSTFSSDLLTTILSTTGLLGLLSFSLIFLEGIIDTIKYRNEELIKFMTLALLSLLLVFIIWHGLNVNILWLILGIWYNSLVRYGQILNNHNHKK